MGVSSKEKILGAKTLAELKSIAKEKNIPLASGMTKKQVVETLSKKTLYELGLAEKRKSSKSRSVSEEDESVENHEPEPQQQQEEEVSCPPEKPKRKSRKTSSEEEKTVSPAVARRKTKIQKESEPEPVKEVTFTIDEYSDSANDLNAVLVNLKEMNMSEDRERYEELLFYAKNLVNNLHEKLPVFIDQFRSSCA